jgi:hypothetical protein
MHVTRERLFLECKAVRERWGGAAKLRISGERVWWEYTVCESGRSWPIRVEYTSGYPNRPPEIHSVKELPAACPHRRSPTEICWIEKYSDNSDWSPARDTAAVAIGAAHRWFVCFLVWLTLNRWPQAAND